MAGLNPQVIGTAMTAGFAGSYSRQRGSIQVKCQRGTPALGGVVYVRTKPNGAYSSAVVGGFEAEDDSGNVVQLTNCQWGGAPDANGIAELIILTRLNA